MKSMILTACLLVGSLCAQNKVTRYVTTCEQQNTQHDAPNNTWRGNKNHSTGEHGLQYFWHGQCKYTTVQGSDQSPCQTDQLDHAVFLGSTDTGQVYGYPSAYHDQLQATTQAQAHSPNSSTSISGIQAGNAVFNCNTMLGGCGTISVSAPPFSVTNGTAIEQGVFTYGDSCPKKTYLIQTCTYNPRSGYTTCTGGTTPGVTSPLMLDLSGAGPFHADANNSGTDIYQLTDAAHGIRFKLAKQGSWKKTKPQQIAWPKKGSHLAVLVLPDEDGRIRNSDQLFGNNTSCGDKLCHDGFAALAFKCDTRQNGGNEDGVCDDHDATFQKLRLLLGAPNSPDRKLLAPWDVGIVSFNVRDYKELVGNRLLSDTYNNQFRYEGTVDFGVKALDGGETTQIRPIYDVFLQVLP